MGYVLLKLYTLDYLYYFPTSPIINPEEIFNLLFHVVSKLYLKIKILTCILSNLIENTIQECQYKASFNISERIYIVLLKNLYGCSRLILNLKYHNSSLNIELHRKCLHWRMCRYVYYFIRMCESVGDKGFCLQVLGLERLDPWHIVVDSRTLIR